MSKILLKPQSRAGQISPIVFLIFLGISGYLNAQTFAYVSNKQQIKQGEPTDPATPKARQLVQVFNELKSHYGVTFMYEDRVLVGKTIVGAIQYEAKIEKTLDVLLKPIGLKYKEVKTGTFVITDDQTKKSSKALFQEGVNLKSIDSKPLVESIGEANGSVSMVSSNGMSVITPADVPIRGKVTDINGVPLPGANITLKNSQKGTTTAADGSFSFDVPTQNAIIVVSYIGYEGMEVRIGNQTMFNIKLKIDDKSLNEVVVIGYGSRDK